MNEFLEKLNPSQKEAVLHIDSPLIIFAGAGTGKTRVITHRIAHLITQGVSPMHILAVTFTNKAAEEMRKRVDALVPGKGRSVWISTFHSFCAQLLRVEAKNIKLNPEFLVYDSSDQKSVLKACVKELKLDEKKFKPGRFVEVISRAKDDLLDADSYAIHASTSNDYFRQTAATVYSLYQKKLDEAGALDFGDLLLKAVNAMKEYDSVREKYQERFRYLLVDEYQDTNHSQYVLTKYLSAKHKNICVVGDDDQSIYSWRGADIRNILDFERDFPKARIIRLEQNYRSTKTILAAAGAVVENNKARKGKKLWTEGAEGEHVGMYAAFDAENEALFIADTTEKHLAGNPGDRVAILYRTHAQSRRIEEALRRYGRKYNIVGGFSFYQRAEIKDTVAYLKLAASNLDSVSLLRIINTPARGIGRTTVEQIERYGREHGLNLWDSIGRVIDDEHLSTRSQSALVTFRNLIQELSLVASSSPLPDLLRFILERTGYRHMLQQEKTPESESRLENLDELVNAAAEAGERGETIGDFLDHAALVSEADAFDEDSPVNLMTLHNAKGLEFPLVFLTGLEMGLFPHSRSMDSEEMLEEERRLCYVGMTRARKRLILTWARYRRRFGGGEQERTSPSGFLNEVPAHLVDDLGPRDEPGEVDLLTEREDVRQSARRNTFTGKTYNSLDNISQFFIEVAPPLLHAATWSASISSNFQILFLLASCPTAHNEQFDFFLVSDSRVCFS